MNARERAEEFDIHLQLKRFEERLARPETVGIQQKAASAKVTL
jgi:hypothetical protein